MIDTKTIRKGSIVVFRENSITSQSFGRLSNLGFFQLDDVFTVLTQPKMIVASGHEYLVVDLMKSDGKILEHIPTSELEWAQ